MSTRIEPIVLVHGGAGDTPDSTVLAKITGCKNAALEGYRVFSKGGSALDAVEAAVRVLEADIAFNAGYGSVLNIDGDIEMDASIMNGSDLRAGAVTLLKDVAHPISVARLVMEKTPHVILGANGCKDFADEHGVKILPRGALITKQAEEALEHYKKYGGDFTETENINNEQVDTVGAVAIDSNGLLAAATSTGGICGKLPGRGSDSSSIGSGSYADNRFGAVSTTGHGEAILRYCLAHSIITKIERGEEAQHATTDCITSLTKQFNKTAGAITISKNGDVGIDFSSKRMSWAYRSKFEIHYGIDPDQHEVENLQN